MPMPNRVVRFGPAFVSNAAANLVNPPTVAGGTGIAGTINATYVLLNHIALVNKSGAAVTITMYIGLTGGSLSGTEVIAAGLSIPQNSTYHWYGKLRLDIADFLTGSASAATAIVFQAEGEIGVV